MCIPRSNPDGGVYLYELLFLNANVCPTTGLPSIDCNVRTIDGEVCVWRLLDAIRAIRTRNSSRVAGILARWRCFRSCQGTRLPMQA